MGEGPNEGLMSLNLLRSLWHIVNDPPILRSLIEHSSHFDRRCDVDLMAYGLVSALVGLGADLLEIRHAHFELFEGLLDLAGNLLLAADVGDELVLIDELGWVPMPSFQSCPFHLFNLVDVPLTYHHSLLKKLTQVLLKPVNLPSDIFQKSRNLSLERLDCTETVFCN